VLLERLDALRALGVSADGTLEAMARLLQQMAVLQAVPGALDASDPEHADALRLAPAMPTDETQLLYSIVLQGRGELSLMSDEYGALTMVLLRMLAFAPAGALSQATVAPARPASSPPAAQRGTNKASEPPPWLDEAPPPEAVPSAGSAALRAAAPPTLAVAPASPPPSMALVTTPLGDRWAGVVARLVGSGAVTALVRELAQQAGLERIDSGTQPPTWHLQVERDSLRTDALRDKLCQALATELGEPLQLALHAEAPQDSPARRDVAERERRQRRAEDAIRNDPLVLDLMSQFKTARIVPGSIKPL
jgi:DNA polymerase III subunit gamma/tau